MEFEKVNKEHILQGIKDFEEKGSPNEFGPSSTYDLVYEGKKYPPKAVMAYANFHASERKIERYFKGGLGTDCFKAYERNGFEIVAKDKNMIGKYLEEFSAIADNWFQKQDWFQERYDYYQQFFTKENLAKAEWEDFQEMGNHIHSFNSMAIAKGNALGKMNLPIEEYRRIFIYFLKGDDPLNIRINNLYKKYDGNAYLPYFSDSSISELVAYAFPDKYVTYNRRDEKALEILGLKLDKVKSEKFGDKFIRYNELLQPVLEQYNSIVGQRTNTTTQLELDQFFSWLYENKKADKPIRDLISRYKTLIRTKGLDQEKYKWEFIRDYKGKPNFDNDILDEVKSIKFTNLLYHLSVACLKDIASNFGPELIAELKALEDDTIDLDERIIAYKKNTTKLYRSINNTKESNHQDERTAAVFLALKNPEEHTFYKSSYYKDYCEYLDVKPGKANHKYSHYLELVKELAEDYISKDEELINLVKDELGDLMNQDPNYLLLAQDMLFQVIGNERDDFDMFEMLQKFLKQADTGDLKTKQFPNSYLDNNFKVSFGQGVSARIPWVAIYKDPNTVSKGIYPVYLYYKELNKLVLSYGISETEKPELSWGDLSHLQEIKEWHIQETGEKPDRYGDSFIKAIYAVGDKLDSDQIRKDLEEILEEYDKLFNNCNYWVFQGNPKHYDIASSIRDKALKTWSVKAHKDKIKEGDKIILWVTGDNAGCYALGEVGSEVYEGIDDENEMKYYTDKSNNENGNRVDISISHNLIDAPITKNQIEGIKELSKLNVGNQGTNFSATEEEYLKLLELASGKIPEDEKRLVYRLSKIGKEDSVAFYNKLEELIHHLELSPKDPRVCYNLPKNVLLGLTVGQKYALTIRRVYQKNILNYMDTKSNDDSWYHEVNSFSELKEAEDAYKVSTKNELLKTDKTGYEKSSSLALEKSLFDENYRKHVFALAFENGPIKEDIMIEPINAILYGPPGTGKTYRLKNEYFDTYSEKISSSTIEELLMEFVGDLTWFKVLTIALSEMGSVRTTDLLTHKLISAKFSLTNPKNPRNSLWGRLQEHTVENCEHVKSNRRRKGSLLFYKDQDSVWSIAKDLNPNDYWEEFEEIKEEYVKILENKLVDKVIKRYDFVTFHQSFAYEDFIEGIKPVLNDDESDELKYEIEDGIFKRICNRAKANQEKPYALFIDEINRGNVASIFGELITLIENDKRAGMKNQMSTLLPYSKEEFSVPKNLHIYGTMNTADRSVEALDTALRRRFSFIEMMPDASLLKGKNVEGIDLKKLLETINERVEVLVDRDHTIGHSYFMDVDDKEDLMLTFKDKVIPLLQEYFYGDYGKIGLVLGKGFVEKKKKNSELFPDFDYDGKGELNREYYILKTIDDSFPIIEALDQLLNEKKPQPAAQLN